MTTVTPNATPKRLKKRNLGKLATAGVATFAGLALAASAFNISQPGSATFTPEYDEGTTPADSDTVTVSEMMLDVQFATSDPFGPKDGTFDPSEISEYEISDTFTITNASDERADIRLLSIVPMDPASLSFYNDIHVIIVRRDPGNQDGNSNEVYRGKLSEIGLSGAYMGDVVDGGEQIFDVYAWSDGTTAEENPEALTTAWQIDYGVYAYGSDDTSPDDFPNVG